MVKRELELSEQGILNLARIALEVAKNFPDLAEENLRTVQECIAYLDYDGDYVVKP